MNKLLINVPERIETKRLILQMPSAGWGEKMHDAILDGYDDYVTWLGWPQKMPTVAMVEEDCRRQHGEFILRDFIRYMILDKKTKEVLGRIGLPPTLSYWDIPQFGISYFIRESKRSKGYATEATQALTRLAFRVLKAKKVELWCDADNIASLAIPLKIGFNLEYKQRGRFPRYDGVLVDLQVYSLFFEDKLPKWDVTW